MRKSGVTLGIDTSGTRGSVAILPPEGTARGRTGAAIEECFSKGMIHGVALAPTVKKLLDRAGLAPRNLSLIAVGIGPGSYTGVRVGVAFAKTLALTAGVELVGVSSLDAIARNAPLGCGPVVSARDARRETLYIATYVSTGTGVRPDRPLALLPLLGIADLLPAGALVLGDAIPDFGDHLSGDGRTFGDPELWHAGALTVARLGRESSDRLKPGSVHELAPIYLRRSEAEEKWAELGRDE